MSFVYLISAVGTTRYKIGFTTNNPKKRLASMTTGSPYPLEVVTYKRGTVTDERDLHIELRSYRLHGEWFDFPNRRVLYKYFPELRRAPRPKKEPQQRWSQLAVATEIALQVTAYAMLETRDYVKRTIWHPKHEIGNTWFFIADRLGFVNTRPKLSDEDCISILRTLYKLQELEHFAGISGQENEALFHSV